jgi:hypothetical protein
MVSGAPAVRRLAGSRSHVQVRRVSIGPLVADRPNSF